LEIFLVEVRVRIGTQSTIKIFGEQQLFLSKKLLLIAWQGRLFFLWFNRGATAKESMENMDKMDKSSLKNGLYGQKSTIKTL
jgi:hypothetical protein